MSNLQLCNISVNVSMADSSAAWNPISEHSALVATFRALREEAACWSDSNAILKNKMHNLYVLYLRISGPAMLNIKEIMYVHISRVCLHFGSSVILMPSESIEQMQCQFAPNPIRSMSIHPRFGHVPSGY